MLFYWCLHYVWKWTIGSSYSNKQCDDTTASHVCVMISLPFRAPPRNFITNISHLLTILCRWRCYFQIFIYFVFFVSWLRRCKCFAIAFSPTLSYHQGSDVGKCILLMIWFSFVSGRGCCRHRRRRRRLHYHHHRQSDIRSTIYLNDGSYGAILCSNVRIFPFPLAPVHIRAQCISFFFLSLHYYPTFINTHLYFA